MAPKANCFGGMTARHKRHLSALPDVRLKIRLSAEDLAMLKLSDPFELNDLFVGIFYNAETEGMASKEPQKSSQRLKRLFRHARAVWRKLLGAFEGIRATEVLTVKSRRLNAASDENEYGFRPLTKREKEQFLNSLDEKGQNILAELAGKKNKKRSGRPVAQAANPNPVSIAPDVETSEKGKAPSSDDLNSDTQFHRMRWLD